MAHPGESQEMNRIIVTHKKHVLLEIKDGRCRYYPNTKEYREFCLQDIEVIERFDAGSKTMVYIRDRDDRILAEFPLYNTEGGTAALRFFRDCNQGRVTDSNGNPMQQFDIIVTRKPETEEQKNRREKNQHERKQRDVLRAQWAEKPLFYETSQWKGRIRFLSRLLTLFGVVLAIHMSMVTFETAAFWYVVYPVTVWIFYLCFHRVLVWDVLHPLEEYILPPFLGLLLMSYIVLRRGEQYNLPAGQGVNAILFRVFLAVVLLCPFFIQWYQEKGVLEWKAPVLYVLAYSLMAMMSWNVLFTADQPDEKPVVLVDKEKKVHSYGRGKRTYYYFTGETEDGERIRGNVAGIYQQAEIGDQIRLCRYESIFGIEYYEFQPTEDSM